MGSVFVPDLALTARSPLAGYDEDFGGVRIAETPGFALVSIATSEANKAALKKDVAKAYGLTLPDGDKSAAKGAVTFISSAASQWLLRFPHSDRADPSADVRAKLGGQPSITDQSDNWVQIEISGDRSTDVLERICPLDLSDQNFTAGSAGRTSMEHLGAIIQRSTKGDKFLLLSASSSARSFLHALQVSVRNVL